MSDNFMCHLFAYFISHDPSTISNSLELKETINYPRPAFVGMMSTVVIKSLIARYNAAKYNVSVK